MNKFIATDDSDSLIDATDDKDDGEAPDKEVSGDDDGILIQNPISQHERTQ